MNRCETKANSRVLAPILLIRNLLKQGARLLEEYAVFGISERKQGVSCLG